jgi:hypothetical protein
MDSTIDQLNTPMSLTKKTFLSAGGALMLAGILRAGSAGKSYAVTRKSLEELNKAKNSIQSKYAPNFTSIDASLKKHHDAINKSVLPLKEARKFFRTFTHGVSKADTVINIGKEIAQAEHAIANNKDAITKSLPKIVQHLDKLDTILPIIGATSIMGGLLSEKKAGLLEDLIKASKEKAKGTFANEANVGVEKKAGIQATKESENKPKYLPRPNLIAGKPDYERKDQMQPVHETVDGNTLTKIAEAINSLFPKVSKEEVFNKEIQKKDKKIDKHKVLLANSEMAHQEKDMQLKQMKSAIKEVNKKLEHYRGKAIEHFTNQLDTEANAV